MTKKSKFALLLTCMVTMVFALIMGINMFAPVAKADTAVFEMETKASVRMTEGSSGIRFRVKMDSATASAVEAAEKSGILIFPAAYLTASEMVTPDGADTAEEYVDNTLPYHSIRVDANEDGVADAKYRLRDYAVATGENGKMIVYQSSEDSYYYANGVLVNIKEANYGLQFAAVAYYGNDTDGYEYATITDGFSRSITDVLSSTYLRSPEYREQITTTFDWFGTSAENAIQISNIEDFTAFAQSTADETYEGLFVNIAKTIDLGSGDGTNLPYIDGNFAGTLSATDGVKMTYESSDAYAAIADDYALVKDFYTCTFNMGRMWTDKIVSVKRISADATSLPAPTTFKSYNKEYFDKTVTDNDITSAKGYEKAYKDYFFALNFGFDLEDYASVYTHLTFKVMYNAYGSTAYSADTKVYGGLSGTATGQYALLDTVYLTEDGANKWTEYKINLANVIENQNKHLGSKYESEPGYVRLFNILSSQVANIYVADVKFVTDFSGEDYTANVGRYRTSINKLTAVEVTTDTFENAGEVSTFYRDSSYADYYYSVDFGCLLTKETLTEYNYLQVWLGFNSFESTTTSITVHGLIDLDYKITQATSGKLVRYLISVDDLIAAQGNNTINSTSVNLFYYDGVMASGSSSSGTRPYVYFGDVKFVEETFTQIPSSVTYQGLKNNGAGASFYWMQTELPTTVNANGYTGKVVGGEAMYNEWVVDINIKLEDYDLTGYTHLSVWLGSDVIESFENSSKYYLWANSSTVFGKDKFLLATSGTADDDRILSGAMTELLVPIEDVKSFYEENGYIRLFRFYRTGAASTKIYLGETKFVTVAE